MSILQIGKPKSGNYWLYSIIQEALKLSNVQIKSYIKSQPVYSIAKNWQLSYSNQAGIDVLDFGSDQLICRISSMYKEEITDFEAYLNQCSHVWTHSEWVAEQELVYRAFDKIVYIIRDPRDVAISMANFSFTPYGLSSNAHKEKDPQSYLNHRLYGSVLAWVRHVGNYMKMSDGLDIYFVFYERLLSDFDREVAGLLNYLGLPLRSNDIKKIHQIVDFSAMKKENPKHVNKGKKYRWADRLTALQNQRVVNIAGEMLKLLNYPLDVSMINQDITPMILINLNHSELDQIIRNSRGGLLDKLLYAFYFATSKRSLQEKLTKGWDFLKINELGKSKNLHV